MLKGHVFKKQIFGNQIFALFIDTFLNSKCGVLGNYTEKMQVTYSGNILTVSSGCACIRGRFVEEDTNTPITADTDTAFCKLVIEIDLDKENTDENLIQASYKIIKSASSYPVLTQTDIVANNSGVYQFELAQFRTGLNGITDFVDKRTYLDFKSIYAEIGAEYRTILEELEKELTEAKVGSLYVLRENVENNLTSTSTTNVLSAAQGKVLNDSKAPNSHASTATTYGVGTANNYGHCKVINNLTTASAADGQALNAYQGKVLNDKFTPVSLYNNASGSNGTITLSQSAANFDYLEIFYKDNNGNGHTSSRVYNPNGASPALSINSSFTTGSMIYTETRNRKVLISGTTISTVNTNYAYMITGGSALPTHTHENHVYIYKVVGYIKK